VMALSTMAVDLINRRGEQALPVKNTFIHYDFDHEGSLRRSKSLPLPASLQAQDEDDDPQQSANVKDSADVNNAQNSFFFQAANQLYEIIRAHKAEDQVNNHQVLTTNMAYPQWYLGTCMLIPMEAAMVPTPQPVWCAALGAHHDWSQDFKAPAAKPTCKRAKRKAPTAAAPAPAAAKGAALVDRAAAAAAKKHGRTSRISKPPGPEKSAVSPQDLAVGCAQAAAKETQVEAAMDGPNGTTHGGWGAASGTLQALPKNDRSKGSERCGCQVPGNKEVPCRWRGKCRNRQECQWCHLCCKNLHKKERKERQQRRVAKG